ncbi:MAG TPA: hypothetical protein VK066_28965 [Chloroflexota bacterium]|nr:hypothetical protein [Chloroflexota bacterium]
MAAPSHDSAVSERMESFLTYLLAEWRAIPELAQEWAEWSEAERLDYASDWAIREDRLLEVTAAAQQGRLTPGQQQRYVQVQRLVAQHRPLLDRLFHEAGLPLSSPQGATLPPAK